MFRIYFDVNLFCCLCLFVHIHTLSSGNQVATCKEIAAHWAYGMFSLSLYLFVVFFSNLVLEWAFGFDCLCF